MKTDARVPKLGVFLDEDPPIVNEQDISVVEREEEEGGDELAKVQLHTVPDSGKVFHKHVVPDDQLLFFMVPDLKLAGKMILFSFFSQFLFFLHDLPMCPQT